MRRKTSSRWIDRRRNGFAREERETTVHKSGISAMGCDDEIAVAAAKYKELGTNNAPVRRRLFVVSLTISRELS